MAWAIRKLGPALRWEGAETRADRWLNCNRGGIEVVRECIHQADAGMYVPMHCDLRVCPECARRRSRAVARTYAAVLRRVVHRLPADVRMGTGWRPQNLKRAGPGSMGWRLMTLTRYNPGGYDPERLRSQVLETRRFFVDLWRETWGSYRAERVRKGSAGVGCVFALEVAPPSSTGAGGMVHVHVLVYGHYWPQADLSARWHRITGDSHVVDIRAVKLSPRKLARMRDEGHTPTMDDVLRAGVLEVLKYATKPPTESTRDAFETVAAIEYAYAGTRRIGALGIFFGEIQETLEDPEYAPELAGLTCPCCGAPAHAGAIVGPGFLARAFTHGASWHPQAHPNPPPEED